MSLDTRRCCCGHVASWAPKRGGEKLFFRSGFIYHCPTLIQLVNWRWFGCLNEIDLVSPSQMSFACDRNWWLWSPCLPSRSSSLLVYFLLIIIPPERRNEQSCQLCCWLGGLKPPQRSESPASLLGAFGYKNSNDEEGNLTGNSFCLLACSWRDSVQQKEP